jgi:hypothetical protein
MPALLRAFLFYKLSHKRLDLQLFTKASKLDSDSTGFSQFPYRTFTFWQRVLFLFSSFLLFDCLQAG